MTSIRYLTNRMIYLYSMTRTQDPLFNLKKSLPMSNHIVTSISRRRSSNLVTSIHPSQSMFSSPILLVYKKYGTWQFCLGYRVLNSIIIREPFQFQQSMSYSTSYMGRIYTQLDLQSGFHQIRVFAKSIAATSFRTSNGYYEFNVMPFGHQPSKRR